MKKRYMVVTHPVIDKLHLNEHGKVCNKPPMHALVGRYHYVRLDDDTIFVVAGYSATSHNALHNHEKITMLPPVESSRSIDTNMRKIGYDAKRNKHMNVLRQHCSMTDECNTEDIIERVAVKHGPIFAL